MTQAATPIPPQATLDRRFARRLFGLLRLYWVSPGGRRGWALLAAAVALELLTVYANFRIADGQRRLLDALQEHEVSVFFRTIGLYVLIVVAFLFVSTYRMWFRQRLEIHWRSWLTDHYLAQWMSPSAYCQVELKPGDAVDNPDQRIAEDVRAFVASALGLSLSLLSALVTLVSFAGLLWTLSASWQIGFGDYRYQIPGFMMWVAIVYALFAMVITHRVGRRLVPLHFDRQRVEADFRFGLMRFRENVEPIAFARGEGVERRRASDRFRSVVRNFWDLIGAQRNLSLTTGAIGELNSAVPLLVAAPGFFLGQLTLGGIAQTRFAYGQVSGALSWFVNAYQEIAAWRASIERLLSFSDTIELSRQRLASTEGLNVATDDSVELSGVTLSRPDGRPLLRSASAKVEPGERVAVSGPAGVGKTVLFRAMLGMWPFGAGSIKVPEPARTVFLGQKPYLPIGTLRGCVTYPESEEGFSDARIRAALAAFGLDALSGRLDDSEHWEQLLSAAEEQRLALARVLLHEPEWIFLDEATSALDDDEEREVYAVLERALPNAALITAVHRSSVAGFHAKHWELVPHDGGAAELRVAA